jgi:hypothetical protein
MQSLSCAARPQTREGVPQDSAVSDVFRDDFLRPESRLRTHMFDCDCMFATPVLPGLCRARCHAKRWISSSGIAASIALTAPSGDGSGGPSSSNTAAKNALRRTS